MRRAIVWFRRDLSLDDNLAWCDATRTHDEVLPLYVLDDALLVHAGPHRRAQLLGSVGALATEIGWAGGALTIARGTPTTVVADLARRHDVDTVAWNRDVTRYAKARDAEIERTLRKAGVAVATAWSTLVQPPGTVTTAAGSVPKVFTRFYERWRELGPEAAVTPGRLARVLAVPGESLPLCVDAPPCAPGAAAAARVLDEFLERVDAYDATRDDLSSERDATSRLSVHLRFGTISPRAVVRAIGDGTAGRRAFGRQLAWRDWFAHLWDAHDDLAERAMQPRFDAIAWRNDVDEIACWRDGRTGYPIVDAAMRQLAATGWLPNRARMIAASFLVKDLLVDWRIGERHFRHLLADGDVPQNAGNWQWVAGTGPDAAPYFRVFHPVTQARRFDPDGAYVRHWVPELAAIRGGAVHAPWELGPLELAAAGVVLDETYPMPIVDHRAARERALAAYGAARGSPADGRP